VRRRHTLTAAFVMALALGAGPGACGGKPPADDYRVERERMLAAVDADCARLPDVIGRPRLSERVRQAMLAVPRHEFVPPDLRGSAYVNNALPIGHGQTISQPTIVALMTELMQVGPGDTVLEVGTGSGYQAAVLCEVVGGGSARGHVHTIEIVGALAKSAKEKLARLGYANVTVYEGDGYAGVPAHAPYDAVMVTAAPEKVPQALLDQLKPGGRLVLPVGPVHGVQELVVVEKAEDGSVKSREVLPVRFVPMVGE